MKDALPFEQIAADIDALMAGAAAERFEQSVAFEFGLRNRRPVAAKPAIKSCSRRDQRSFEGDHRVEKALRVGLAPVSGTEPINHSGIGVQLANHIFDAAAHVDGVFERRYDMLCGRAEVAFPIKPEVQDGVENR